MNDDQPCQWPKCILRAAHTIYHDDESIMVCSQHRGAVVVNIESQNKIWIFNKGAEAAIKGKAVRPGEIAPQYKGTPHKRPGSPAPDWAKEAAKKADAAAAPAEEVPPPETNDDQAFDRLFKDLLKNPKPRMR